VTPSVSIKSNTCGADRRPDPTPNDMQSLKSFEPTYTELATCLEMGRDVKNIGGSKPTDVMPRR
jgi:hypothetical protein